MKWFCLLLLIANIGYFGWTLDQRTRENLRDNANALELQREVPRLRLVQELEQPPPKRMQVNGPDTDSDEPDLVAKLPGISTTLPESLIRPMRLETDACFSFGPFSDNGRAQRLHDWFKTRDTNARLRQKQADGDQLLWIYLEPAAGGEDTMRELRARGVRDISLIQSGDLENAISLGLFSSQAAVNRRLRELEDKGYQPVVVPYSKERAVYWVDARLVSSETISALDRAFPSGFNYVPVRCDKIALSGSNP